MVWKCGDRNALPDNVHNLLFADDQVVIAKDREAVNYVCQKLVEEFRM